MEFVMPYDALSKVVMTPLFAGRKRTRFTIDDESLVLRMGWLFLTRIPRASLTGAAARPGTVISRGAHGWRGRWLVNAAGNRLVSITIDPPGRGWVVGVPVRISELVVNVEDPDALIAAVQARGT